MEGLHHTNGHSATETAGPEPSGEDSAAAIAADRAADTTTNDLREAVASLGAKLTENLQALGVHLGSADRILANWDDRVRRQIVGVQEQAAAIQRDLQGVQGFVSGLPHDMQAVRQHCDGKLDTLAERFEQRLQSDAQTVAGIGQRLAATTKMLDDKAGQISHLEISVAALIRDGEKMASIETAIGELNQKGGELVATVEELVQRSRSLKRLTVLTSATALILAVAVGMQMLGGWPVVARYVALWTWSPI